MSRHPIAAISWSGGKDSCLAFLRTREHFDFKCAVTMMNGHGTRSRSHGLRPEILRAQTAALGLIWLTRSCRWSSYTASFVHALREIAGRGVTHLVTGDIVYPEHREWVTQVCAVAGLEPVLPLWGVSTAVLYRECLARGIVARIVAVDAGKLSERWLFRALDASALAELVLLGVDPCGERGEYHTVVTECPCFARPLAVSSGVHVQRRGYWAVDVHLCQAQKGTKRR